jgi:UDP-N-acetylmuramoyl-L-alanyl-D-glutamate--2,6-diaminopimelate ligase
VLADLKAAGIDHLAMEASSHGLDQYRLHGVRINIAAFTNLSRDHLDYHHDMESYFQAKKRLFTELLAQGGLAVINADDEYGARLIDELSDRKVFSFGQNGKELKLLSLRPTPGGQMMKIAAKGEEVEVCLPLAGDFQAMNALCALGIVQAHLGLSRETIGSLEKLRGVPGRLQLVDGHPKGAVYVDYAHKPDALENILDTLRQHTDKKLICVFGCGGNRDHGKRAIMGQIANDKADTVIVTDDNPRDENPAAIRQAILESAPNALEIGDRGDAIRKGVTLVEEGDILVIAGKGHEEGQTAHGIVQPFNDVTEAEKAIAGLKK